MGSVPQSVSYQMCELLQLLLIYLNLGVLLCKVKLMMLCVCAHQCVHVYMCTHVWLSGQQFLRSRSLKPCTPGSVEAPSWRRESSGRSDEPSLHSVVGGSGPQPLGSPWAWDGGSSRGPLPWPQPGLCLATGCARCRRVLSAAQLQGGGLD